MILYTDKILILKIQARCKEKKCMNRSSQIVLGYIKSIKQKTSKSLKKRNEKVLKNPMKINEISMQINHIH